MRKYLDVIRISFLEALEYRTELFIRIFGWGMRLLISVFLWYAVIQASGGNVGGYSFRQMVIYFFLVQIMASFMFNDSGFDISRDIQYGDFSNHLVKPIRYLPFRFAVELSYNFTRAAIGILLFGGILLFVEPEFFSFIARSPLKFVSFLVSISFAMLINFHLVSLIALLSFWIISAQRLLFMYFGIINIFSGLIIPLDLFPETMLTVLRFLPFSYIFYFPLEIIIKSDLSIPTYILTVIIPQILHLGVLFFILTTLYHFGLKRYEAVGR